MMADTMEIAAFMEQVCRDSDHPVATFWREYWLGIGYLPRLLRSLEKLSPLLKGNPSVLDIGGFGELLLILRKFYGLNSVYDVSIEGNLFGYRQGRLVSGDNPDLEYSIKIDACDVEREHLQHGTNSLDIVTCFEVLEHLRYDPMFMLLEIQRVLRPGGVLFLSTPNCSSWESFARVAAFESPFTFSSYFADGTGIGHCKEYSVLELRRALEESGFSIDKIETLDSLPPDSSLEQKLGELKVFVLSRDWWDQSLRGQTLLVQARKVGKPKRRMCAPLYTAELWYADAKEPPPEGEAKDAEKVSGFQSSELMKEVAGLRKYIAALQADTEARTRWALECHEELKRERAAKSKLEAEFDARGRWCLDLDKEIEKQRERIAELEHRLEVHALQIHSLKSLTKQIWHRIWHR